MRAMTIAFLLVVVAGCGTEETQPELTTTSAAISTSPTLTTATSISSTSTTSTTSTTIYVPAAGEIMAEVIAELTATGPRVAGSPEEHLTADYLAYLIDDLNLPINVDHVQLPNELGSRNVWTMIGDGPTTVLLGAHYDSVPGSPGIDDNGSGVAVLSELMTRLAADPPQTLTVIVAFFGAEERLSGYPASAHHYGSRQMASDMEAQGNLPDFMLSVDMVGVGDRLLAVRYNQTDPTARDLLVSAGESVGVTVVPDSRGDISDHEGSPRRSCGVPTTPTITVPGMTVSTWVCYSRTWRSWRLSSTWWGDGFRSRAGEYGVGSTGGGLSPMSAARRAPYAGAHWIPVPPWPTSQ